LLTLGLGAELLKHAEELLKPSRKPPESGSEPRPLTSHDLSSGHLPSVLPADAISDLFRCSTSAVNQGPAEQRPLGPELLQAFLTATDGGAKNANLWMEIYLYHFQ
jgi:hypothetical protein